MPELDFVMSPKHAREAVSEPRPNATEDAPESAPESRAHNRLERQPGRPERREDKRHPGPRQVWIQGTDANGDNVEEVQNMRNYSQGGFYFVTNLHCYRVGMHLTVIPAFGSLNMEYVAEVVRVEPKPKMAYGVGVKLLHVREPMARPNPA